MEKKEKFAKLDNLIGELGLGSDEVVAYFQKKGQPKTVVSEQSEAVVSDGEPVDFVAQEQPEATVLEEEPKEFDVTLLNSKKFVTPKVIEPGMYFYKDGLIYPEIIKGNEITAVVGHISKIRLFKSLGIRLCEKVLPWSSVYGSGGVRSYNINETGGSATAAIIHGVEDSRKVEAARYCDDFPYGSVLPTKTELVMVYLNRKRVNEALRKLGVAEMNGIYWSSTEFSRELAFVQNFSDNNNSLEYYPKSYGLKVRPFCYIRS